MNNMHSVVGASSLKCRRSHAASRSSGFGVASVVRGSVAVVLTMGVAGVFSTTGCGADACATVCEDSYDREVACNLFVNAGDRGAAVDACKQSLESNGATDDQCSSAADIIEGETCAQLATAACPSVPAANQGSGCKGGA